MTEIDELINPHPTEVADLQGRLRWFARLALASRETDDNLSQIKAKMAELEQGLIEDMAAAGVDRQTVDGITIYPQTDLIVSKKAEKDGVTTDDLVAALRNCGLSYMVSEGYSASSLKSKVKEWRDQGVEVPAELAEKLNILDRQKLVTRKA